MVFLRNKDNNPEKWKDKYMDLLGSIEEQEKAYKANEDLLCKTIIRFAIAVKGLNRELDPHLTRIRNLLKSGLQSQQLKKELESFTNALMLLGEDSGSIQVDAYLLFEFLYRQYPQHKSQLENLQDRYENREFKNTQVLIVALLELVDEKSSGTVYFGVEIPDAEHKAIRAHLLRFLDYADIPENFTDRLHQIKARLQNDLDIKSLVEIFDHTVTLFLAVKKHQSLEQNEMTEFLAKLTEKLAELAAKATGVDHETEEAIKNRHQFDETVAKQMVDLQNKSASATHLDALKQLVHTHLSSISQQIHTQNAHELQDREKFQQNLHNLTTKIREMEVESNELKEKLEIAQQNSMRDPLTHLPNRLAYDLRLGEEIARCKRSGHPLSLLVWDIDFFKKINDNYGHKSGDKALIVISQLLEENSRKADFVARIGGEEFVMLLPDTDLNTAKVVANKLRETIETANFKVLGDKISITLSCGISQFSEADTLDSIFERADSALYQAKQNGRNQCVVIK
jgi:diguanylate cyclase